jgi:site-specific DNA recombinase
MSIAIYSRKSRFTGKGESIENQIEMCYDYIHKNFSNISDEEIFVYEDEGFSGKNMNRPQFKQMMEKESSSPFEYIIVYRLDRISRNVGEFATLVDRLNGAGTSFVSIKEQFDTSSPMGRAMMNIAATFAQLERETIAERVKDNMYMLAKTGRWLGGVTPIGYSSKQIVANEGGIKRTHFTLYENPDELKTVLLIFEKYMELRSMTKLVSYLVMSNIKTRRGCDFAVSTIRTILTNPVYCVADADSYQYFDSVGSDICCTLEDCDGQAGFVGYRKTTAVSDSRRNATIDEWIIAVGKHKGLIKGKSWVEVQHILSENADCKQKFTQSHNPVALLSGILFCNCDNYMRPKYHRVNKLGFKPFSYMCELKEVSKKTKCSTNNLNGIYADKVVCDTLLNYELEDNIFNKYLKNLKTKSHKDNFSEEIKNKEKLIKNKQMKINNLIATLTQGINDIVVKYVNDEVSTLNNDIEIIKSEIDKLKLQQQNLKNTNTTFDEMSSTLKYFKEHFNELSVEYKRIFIKKCISKIVWDGENLNIFI